MYYLILFTIAMAMCVCYYLFFNRYIFNSPRFLPDEALVAISGR